MLFQLVSHTTGSSNLGQSAHLQSLYKDNFTCAQENTQTHGEEGGRLGFGSTHVDSLGAPKLPGVDRVLLPFSYKAQKTRVCRTLVPPAFCMKCTN